VEPGAVPVQAVGGVVQGRRPAPVREPGAGLFGLPRAGGDFTGGLGAYFGEGLMGEGLCPEDALVVASDGLVLFSLREGILGAQPLVRRNATHAASPGGQRAHFLPLPARGRGRSNQPGKRQRTGALRGSLHIRYTYRERCSRTHH